MIWALLALLGIPIWLIAGVLIGIVLTRRAFQRQPGVFPVAVRKENSDKWPRQSTYGRLVHDVLVLNRGAAFLRVEIHAIAAVDELDIGDGPKSPVAAVGRLVTLDDGTRLELALAAADATRLDAASGITPSDR